MAGRLEGKVAIITGGVSGMGLAATELFIQEGAKLVIADIQDEKGAALEKRFPGSLRFSRCDIRRESDWAAAVHLARESFGGLDVMYHNAGAVGDNTPIEHLTTEGWDDTQNLLLRSSWYAIKHAIAPMRERGKGSIILTSSASAVSFGGPGPFAYAVAKAGVITAGKIAAIDLAPLNIRVNTIIPGAIPTSIWSGHVGGGANVGDKMGLDIDQFASMQPLPQAGEARDIAEGALYFASDASKFVTGVAIPIDGGLSLHRKVKTSDILGSVKDAADKLAGDH